MTKSNHKGPPTKVTLGILCKRLKDKLGQGHIALQQSLETIKFESVLRNFAGHARGNEAATVSATEVRRAVAEWFALEAEFWCNNCQHYVVYLPAIKTIQCNCGKVKLERTQTTTPVSTTV